MLNIAMALLIIGAAFLMAEAFIPGFGVFGISGVILLVISAVITFIYAPFGPFIVLGAGAVFVLIIYILYKIAKRKQLGGDLILRETLLFKGSAKKSDLDGYIGKEGITKTALKPFGTVDFNGVSVSVCSDGAYISEHKRVKVISVEGHKIIVAPFNQN